MNCKYIIVDGGAIIFGEHIAHSMVAESFPHVYSAGWFNDEGKVPKCYGESTSLEIKSDPIRDIHIVLDLFAKISKIKYGLINVKEFYE